MTWTYDMDFTVPRDEVRFLVSDTDEAEQLVQDEEIDYILTQNANDVKTAALDIARVIHANFSKMVDTEVGDLKKFWSQRVDSYEKVVLRLEKEALTVSVPYAGGISNADKDSINEDTDRVVPTFTKEKHNNAAPLNDSRLLE